MHNIWGATKNITPIKETVGAETIYAFNIDDIDTTIISQAIPKFSSDDYWKAVKNIAAGSNKCELRYTYFMMMDWVPIQDRTYIITPDTYAPSKDRRYDIRKELENGYIFRLTYPQLRYIFKIWDNHPVKSYDKSHIFALMDDAKHAKFYGYFNKSGELKSFAVFLVMYPEMFYWLGSGGNQSCLIDKAIHDNKFEWFDLGGCRRDAAYKFKSQFGGKLVEYRRWCYENSNSP